MIERQVAVGQELISHAHLIRGGAREVESQSKAADLDLH